MAWRALAGCKKKRGEGNALDPSREDPQEMRAGINKGIQGLRLRLKRSQGYLLQFFLVGAALERLGDFDRGVGYLPQAHNGIRDA